MKHLDDLNKAIKTDNQTIQALFKAQKILLAISGASVLAAVTLKFMGARAIVVIALGLIGGFSGLGTALLGRKIESLQKRVKPYGDELNRIIGAVERKEKSSPTPLTIGFANLSGKDLDGLASQDAELLGRLFIRARVVEHHQIPSAEILFVYAHLNEDGTIEGPKPSGIRQIVQATNAAIIVLASPNSPESIKNAAGLPGPKTANLVFTVDRNGDGFGRFFKELFEKMQAGQDMLSAWVAISPQHPSANPAYAPQTILLAEGGKIAFPRA
ncbi:hypothetical protein [Pelomonas sp. Root1217]|uniref:hypothetical protein n=1 Tax=Pelomonas sp. Root1217 TaxID=1736430 RepID=UPI001F1B3AC7|nr:hypothetical protein [Pelomonas sp. Root1217]